MYEYAFEIRKQRRAWRNTNWVLRCHSSDCLAFEIVYCIVLYCLRYEPSIVMRRLYRGCHFERSGFRSVVGWSSCRFG